MERTARKPVEKRAETWREKGGNPERNGREPGEKRAGTWRKKGFLDCLVVFVSTYLRFGLLTCLTNSSIFLVPNTVSLDLSGYSSK